MKFIKVSMLFLCVKFVIKFQKCGVHQHLILMYILLFLNIIGTWCIIDFRLEKAWMRYGLHLKIGSFFSSKKELCYI